MKFADIKNKQNIYLFHGDIQDRNIINNKFVFTGLSINKEDNKHIKHDITKNLDIYDNTVDIIQSEDVLEHIEYNKLTDILNETYRVLKPGGLFRLSVPDYRCDILYNRSIKKYGKLIFDPHGGGKYDKKNNKVIEGGHVWFPTYEKVLNIFKNSKFDMDNVKFLHYYDENNNPVLHDIDYSKGFITRVPDFDKRVQNPKRPMSIVVDCFK